MDHGKAKNIHANRTHVGVGESAVDIAIVSGRTCRDFPVTSWCGFGFCPLLPPGSAGESTRVARTSSRMHSRVAHRLHRRWRVVHPGLRKGNACRCITHMARLTVLDPPLMCVFVGMHVLNPVSNQLPEGRPAMCRPPSLILRTLNFSI